MVRHGRYDRKALLVITDGFDNASWNTKGATLKYAQQFNVAIYSIGFGLPNRMVDMETLGELADATRAKTYNVRSAGEGDELKKDIAAVAAAVGNRYDIGWTQSSNIEFDTSSDK